VALGLGGELARQISFAGASLGKMRRGPEIERLYDWHAQPLMPFS
jgi:hypothetical protein